MMKDTLPAEDIVQNQAEVDEKVNIFLAENFDNHHVVGKARCSYDSCSAVYGPIHVDLPFMPVFVRNEDWNDPDNMWREEVYRPRVEIENAEKLANMAVEHPDWDMEEIKAGLTAHEYYVGGWHMHGLEPVYSYTGDGHQTQRILEEMKKRGWQVQISSELGGIWTVSIDVGLTGAKHSSIESHKDFTRAVAYAAARALGMA